MWFPHRIAWPFHKRIAYMRLSWVIVSLFDTDNNTKVYTMFATLRGFDCVLLCVIYFSAIFRSFVRSFILSFGCFAPKDNMKRALQIGIATVMAGTSTHILMMCAAAVAVAPQRIPFTGTVFAAYLTFSFIILMFTHLFIQQQQRKSNHAQTP